MRHTLAFLIKFTATLTVLGIILGLLNNLSIVEILTVSIILSTVGYIMGDLFILRITNNFIASIADFALAFFVIWSMSRALTYVDDIFTASLAAALGLTIFEYFYHRMISKNTNKRETSNHKSRQRNTELKMEASEEFFTPVRPDVRSPEEDNEKDRNTNKND